jgi:hypothetical protein
MVAWFSRQSIQSRLLLIFSGLILWGAIGVGLGVLAITRLSSLVEQGVAQADTAQGYAHLDSLLLQQELALYQFAQNGDAAYLRQYSNLEISLDYHLRLLIGSSSAGEQGTYLRLIAADLEDLNRQADVLLAPNGDSQLAAARQQALAQSVVYGGLRQRLQELADQGQAAMLASVVQIRNLAIWLVLGGAGLLAGFVVFVVVAALVVDDLAYPMLVLTTSMTAYQNGAFQPAMLQRYLQRGDELGMLATALDQLINTVQQQKQEQDRLLASMERFFPRAYLDLLQKNSIEQIQLGDHISAEMAVLFSDIRSFTTISEKMTPSQNFSLVNNYLKLVSPVVLQHNGFIVKFLGDGVMAVFPYRVEDALQAAIAKLQLYILAERVYYSANLRYSRSLYN